MRGALGVAGALGAAAAGPSPAPHVTAAARQAVTQHFPPAGAAPGPGLSAAWRPSRAPSTEPPGKERASGPRQAKPAAGSDRERRCSEPSARPRGRRRRSPAPGDMAAGGCPPQDGARLAALVFVRERRPCGAESAKIKVLTERPRSAGSVRALLQILQIRALGENVMLGGGGVKSREITPHPP